MTISVPSGKGGIVLLPFTSCLAAGERKTETEVMNMKAGLIIYDDLRRLSFEGQYVNSEVF